MTNPKKLSKLQRSTILAALEYFRDINFGKFQVEEIFKDQKMLTEDQINKLSDRITAEEEIPFNSCETTTVIGALRFLQHHYSHAVSPTQKYQVLPVDNIDTLCERLNFLDFY